MIVMGIESSCDETAAALVTGEARILGQALASQIAMHQDFGGVVPEIAARGHLEAFLPVIQATLKQAEVNFMDIDAVAATAGPGLVGGVMVGLVAGKALAAAIDKPFIAVNHLEGHIIVPRMGTGLKTPYLVLLVSGGHSQILLVRGVGDYMLLGGTLDDAVGECFDKAARLMGLGYPGGPAVERAADKCQNLQEAVIRFPLPHPLQHSKTCDMSFSGLKTAMRQHVETLAAKGGQQDRAQDIADLCAAFQSKIALILENAMRKACDQPEAAGMTAIVVSGGVAANRTVRAALDRLARERAVDFIAPPPALCTDNAVMIAWAGVERFRLGLTDTLDHPARPRWPLEQLSKVPLS